MIDMQFNSRAGQSLLIIVLLIAVVFTIIASASYRLTTETQSARIQEDTVRTLAAADSGVEKGLQLITGNQPDAELKFKDIGLVLEGINAEASTIEIETGSENAFASPEIQKDEQYTFYLYDYQSNTNFFTNSMNVSFGPSSGATCGASRNLPTLEITLIYGSNQMQRWISEPCGSNPRVSYDASVPNSFFPATPITTTVDGKTFTRRITINFNPFPTPKLLIIRPLFANTSLGFDPVTGTLSSQGRLITSEAVSTTGVSKIVTLFRSNPQIPAEFFVTTF